MKENIYFSRPEIIVGIFFLGKEKYYYQIGSIARTQTIFHKSNNTSIYHTNACPIYMPGCPLNSQKNIHAQPN